MIRHYRTIQGDTWDGIAIKVYGDEVYMSDLLKANPAYNDYYRLPANLQIVLPEIAVKSTSVLPPWKRGGGVA